MATTRTTTRATTDWFGDAVEFDYAEGVAGYVTVLVRLVTGWWFFHAGFGKLTGPEPFDAAGWLVQGTQGAPIHGLLAWAGQTPLLLEFTNLAVPVGELLIGLGLLVGALTRLAAFFGGVLMVLFYLGNADWAHGYVNGDLFGLLMFVVGGVFAAGRIFGVDGYLEETEFVRKRPKLRYLLG
ncbi:thiosulfate dehydrogenase [quinone] large subunit [Halogranum amylolyticum]|uniref:Thiosulfate dehydrogenase [quinone] large subunit n=1 Tax=Halogranum amylolyticum TaxID=660520 RepID=A0A1H8QMM0_9EURY|nr:DoxX family membrane protein [Halogranum amylolyticum]SEO55495.1 thiosulfate dehydrogenase [quinone] large subunit [Halogranum amylolyticum]